MICLDIEYPSGQEVKSDGEAVYRMPKDMKEFLEKVLADNTIIGIEYIPNSWNIGFLVQKKEKNEKPNIIVPGNK